MQILKQIFRISILLISLILLPSEAQAGDITQIKQFSALNGTIDFLPGAWVKVWESGKSTYYRFDHDQFVQADSLPNILKGWESYSSGSADYLDQIAKTDYDPRMKKFLPQEAKVKKVIEYQLKGNEKFSLVCYTLKPIDPDASPNSNDIYATAFVGSRSGSTMEYKKIWDKKLQSDASYGEISIKDTGKTSRLVLLYWEQVGGSGATVGLNIYKISDEKN